MISAEFTFLTVILNFDIEQGARIRWHSWKEQLKISKMAKIESNIF